MACYYLEEAGLDRPVPIQSLWGRSFWSANHLRDLVRDYVAEAVGCSYFVHAPKGTSFAQIAGTAGLRWTVEECFLLVKFSADQR